MKKIIKLLFLFSLVFSQNTRDLLVKLDSLIFLKEYKKVLSMIKKDSNDPELLIRKAKVKSWSGAYDEAIKIFKNLMMVHDNDVDTYLAFLRIYLWNGRANDALRLTDSLLQISHDKKRLIHFSSEVISKHFPSNSERYIRQYWSYYEINSKRLILKRLLDKSRFGLFEELIKGKENLFFSLYIEYQFSLENYDLIIHHQNDLTPGQRIRFYQRKGDYLQVWKINPDFRSKKQNRFDFYSSQESDKVSNISQQTYHLFHSFYFYKNVFYKFDYNFIQFSENKNQLNFSTFRNHFFRNYFNNYFDISIVSRVNRQGWLYGFRAYYSYRLKKKYYFKLAVSKDLVNETGRTIIRGIYKNNYNLGLEKTGRDLSFDFNLDYSKYNDLNERISSVLNLKKMLVNGLSFHINYSYRDFLKKNVEPGDLNYWLANDVHRIASGLFYEYKLVRSLRKYVELIHHYTSINRSDSDSNYGFRLGFDFYFSDSDHIRFRAVFLPSEIWDTKLYHFSLNLMF